MKYFLTFLIRGWVGVSQFGREVFILGCRVARPTRHYPIIDLYAFGFFVIPTSIQCQNAFSCLVLPMIILKQQTGYPDHCLTHHHSIMEEPNACIAQLALRSGLSKDKVLNAALSSIRLLILAFSGYRKNQLNRLDLLFTCFPLLVS